MGKPLGERGGGRGRAGLGGSEDWNGREEGAPLPRIGMGGKGGEAEGWSRLLATLQSGQGFAADRCLRGNKRQEARYLWNCVSG